MCWVRVLALTNKHTGEQYLTLWSPRSSQTDTSGMLDFFMMMQEYYSNICISIHVTTAQKHITHRCNLEVLLTIFPQGYWLLIIFPSPLLKIILHGNPYSFATTHWIYICLGIYQLVPSANAKEHTCMQA